MMWGRRNNSNNNNNRMYIAPYGYGFNYIGAGGRSDKCQSKPEWIKKFLSQDLEQTESLVRTVRGNEFQTDGAENQNAHLEKSGQLYVCM